MTFVPKFYYLPRKKWTEVLDVFEPGENYWKFQDDSNKEQQSDKSAVKESSIEELAKQNCIKKIVDILNEMTPDTLNTLIEEIKNELCDVVMLADIILSKASVDEIYSQMYAELCERIICELSDDHGSRFELVLIYLCETGFGNLLEFTDNELRNIQEDKRCMFKRRLMTIMRFIGELACIRRPIFPIKKIWKMAKCLMDKGEDLHLEAVYFLLLTVSIRTNIKTWPKSIEKEVKRIFKLHSSGISGSTRTNTEEDKKESDVCLPETSCESVSDVPSCENITTEAPVKSLNVEGKISFPDFLYSVVIVSFDTSGIIKPAEIALLKLHIDEMSKSVACFRSQMHMFDAMPIISFSDRFSYDWFISHVNKQLEPDKEKFIYIDFDKYNETVLVTVKVNCDFARGVELFAKTELEILKIISENNADFPTSNWRIVETSIKCVIQSYHFTIRALVDLESSSQSSSLMDSISFGSDRAQVCTYKLPLMCAEEKESLENEVKQTNKGEVSKISLVTPLEGSQNVIDATSIKNKLIDGKENDSALADQNKNKDSRNKLKFQPKFKRKLYRARSFKRSHAQNKNCHRQNVSDCGPSSYEKKCCCDKEIGITVNTTKCDNAKNDIAEASTSNAAYEYETPIKDLMSLNTKPVGNVENNVQLNKSNEWRRARNYKNDTCIYPQHDIPQYFAQYTKNEAPQNQSKPKWKANKPDTVDRRSTSGLTAQQNAFRNQKALRFKEQHNYTSMQSNSRSFAHKFDSAELKIKDTPQQQSPSLNPNSCLKYLGKPLVIGIFPNSSRFKDEAIFNTLNKCNKGLDMSQQMVLCRFDQDNFAQLTFTVEDFTFKVLQKTEFRVRYNAYTIFVKPLTSWGEAMAFSQ